MKIVVYGAGAVGSFFGGFLAKAGHRVSLLGRSWHLDVVRRKGLRITGSMGEFLIRDLKLYTNVKAIYNSPIQMGNHGALAPPLQSKNFDLVLLTVKPKDTEICAKEIAELLKSPIPPLVKGVKKRALVKGEKKEMTPILTIQNGLGNLEILSKYILPSQLLAGRLITSVSIEPGKITVGATADDFLIGEVYPLSLPLTKGENKRGLFPLKRVVIPPKKRGLKRAKEIARVLTDAGIKTREVKDIQKYLWSKMVFNTSLNGLASLLEVTYGDLLKSAESKELIRKTVGEIYNVAEKKGIALDPPSVRSHIRLLFDKLIPTFNSHIPSMLRAIREGKRTDIDFLNGAISRFGMELDVKTPINDMITHLIKAKEGLRRRLNG